MRIMITSSQTLNRLNKEGLILWPITRHGVKSNNRPFKYVDETEKGRMYFTDSKGRDYELRYVPGCFFPYVYRVR